MTASSATAGHVDFRPDIEGLRAIAVALVLLYHAQVDLFAGGFVGVDIFFVLSGYLITRSLVREAESTGRVALGEFYARRVRRLLPAAVLVLGTTAVAVRTLLPQTTWRDFGGDIAAASVYLVNWRLADRSVDYLAEDVQPSPVQHFWSLAIEEQFYLLWPLLVLAGTLIAVRRAWPLRRTVAALLAVIVAVPSFARSVTLTDSEPARAFFDTSTRLWELSIGSLAALGYPAVAAVGRLIRMIVKLVALTALGVAVFVVDPTTAWPGATALAVVLPTAALVVVGRAEDRDVAHRVLSVRPMQRVGAWSYSLYLWHWPPLAVLGARWGGLSNEQALLIVAVSTMPAILAYRIVENPFRYSSRLRASRALTVSVGANLSLLALVAGLVVGIVPATRTTIDQSVGSRFGAAALDPTATDAELLAELDAVTAIVPDPVDATSDLPVTYPDECHVRSSSGEPIICEYGVPSSSTHIALVGDSKAGQWATALIAAADRHGWRVSNITKSECPLSTGLTSNDGEPDHLCQEWGRKVLEQLVEDAPDLVLTGQSEYSVYSEDPGVDGRRLFVDATLDAFRQVEAAGATVSLLLDNPHPGENLYECVAEHREDLRSCTFDRESARQGGRPQQLRVAELGGFPTIDMLDQICPTATCLPVIGGVLVYRQGSHLTATYVASTAPVFEARLQQLIASL